MFILVDTVKHTLMIMIKMKANGGHTKIEINKLLLSCAKLSPAKASSPLAPAYASYPLDFG